MELFTLVAEGDEAAVRDALASDPRLVAVRDEHDVSLTRWALYTGHRELVATLVAAGPPLDIFDAAAVGDDARVTELLAAEPSLATSYSGDGFTALHFAAFLGTPECTAALLDAGADPEARASGSMDVQPLHSAAAGHDVVSARMLLEAGAPVDATQRGGFTPLHEAALTGQLALVEVLLAAGADVTITTDDGHTAVDLARQNDHPKVLQVLAQP